MANALTFHQSFTSDELNSQYNLRAGRPDFITTVIPNWQQRSELARDSIDCQLDINYGNGTKQKLDVFTCGDPAAPTLVYFHGGYWQSGDKSMYSFLAKPFVESRVNVVVVGYDLCPQVSITAISAQAREALAFLWRNAHQLNINSARIAVMGHSAGGHIAQMMMATHWKKLGSDLPLNLIAVGIPISPLSYLEPVRLTDALNSGIQMSAEEAERESPMVNHPPVTNASQLVIVGGAETDEFHRQAQMYVDAYGNSERLIKLYVVPGVDHFDEINVLADSSSPIFCRVHDLIIQS